MILRMSDISNNNKKLPLRFSVNSFKNFGQHHCYGHVITSLREIEMGQEVFNLTNNSNKITGTLTVSNVMFDLKPSLLAYLKSGWRISCGVAIDFTMSNRPYDDPRSNHR